MLGKDCAFSFCMGTSFLTGSGRLLGPLLKQFGRSWGGLLEEDMIFVGVSASDVYHVLKECNLQSWEPKMSPQTNISSR